MIYEKGEENMRNLMEWYSSNKGNRNEASTRFHIIDRLFNECLGWEPDDIDIEERIVGEGKFSDYTFKLPYRIMIIEAKRENLNFSLPDNTERIRTLSSLTRSSVILKKAIDQVIGYCNQQSVPIAAVTNGYQFVIFIATRIDGKPTLEGKAIVFSSLEEMYDNFTYTWNLLSRKCLSKDLIFRTIYNTTTDDLPNKLSKSILSYSKDKKEGSELQDDLKITAELVFNELIGKKEVEENFLKDCYVKTDDLSKYTLLSKEILTNRYTEFTEIGTKLSMVSSLLKSLNPRSTKTALKTAFITEKPILIVGDMNVGKTSFIRNFIKIEANDILEKFINIYINLQTQATFENSIKSFVPKEIVRQLNLNYKIDIYSRNFIRGMYRKELKLFSNSIFSDIKKISEDRYKGLEIKFLDKKIKENPNEHLQRSLKNITKQQKKQIVIFLDNADQRNEEDQRATVLIAQELSLCSSLSLFVSLRPESFSKLIELGILESGRYHSRVFTIQPPAIEDVIKKRLEFAIKVTEGKLPVRLSGGDIKTTFLKLNELINCFLISLLDDKNFSEIIENLSNGDVKLGLELVQDFFGNPHMRQEKILEHKDKGKFKKIYFDQFLKTIILGDNNYYNSDHKCIVNLFDISSFDGKEHFIAPIILGYLDSVQSKNSKGFVIIQNIFDVLQITGFTPTQINNSIVFCLSKSLVEQKKRQIGTSPELLEIRITPRGAYHIKKLCTFFEYMNAMIVDTPIFDEAVRTKFVLENFIRERLLQTSKFCNYLDKQWAEIKSSYFDWVQYSGQLKENMNIIMKKLKN